MPRREEVNSMIAIGAGTLALPRLALRRETVLALAGGRSDADPMAKSKNCSKKTCVLTCGVSCWDICLDTHKVC
jgi:hypothetical protein